VKDITWNQFVRVVEENDREVLPTIGGRKTFRLQRTERGVCFTPRSSGFPRKLNSWDIERYLAVFNETKSFNTSDYTENFRNQSYVLAIIKLIVGQGKRAKLVDDGTSTSGEIDPQFSAQEGKIKVLSHRRRERSRELVEMAKAKFKAEHRRLFCQVCRFDFGKTYGEPDFIEVHHLIPLRDLKEGQRTKLSDLALVCPNCHRMLHRGSLWPSLDELRLRLKR
jgi:predicted HNH restriction endonuclease